MMKWEAGVVGPVDGTGVTDPAGSYVRLVFTWESANHREREEYVISRRAAEVLAAEIVGTLAKK